MTLTTLPHDGPRVETGPLQFGDDWPGVFIRGDDAFALAMYLRDVLRLVPAEGGTMFTISKLYAERLAATLESCNVANLALVTEAGTAETTKIGSVHEGATPKGNAQ